MNKYDSYILTIFISLLMVLTSCDENTNSNSDETDYFPMTIGNYWIFNTYEINSNNQKVTGTEKRDSIVVEQKFSLEGRTAFLLAVYRNEQLFDTLCISIELQKVYLLFDEEDIDVPNYNREWFLIADFTKSSNTEWHLYDSILTNYPYNFEGSIINTTYHHTINGKFELEENYQYNSASIKSRIFQIKYDTRLFFIYKFPDNISTSEVEVNRLRQKYYHFTFAENLGFVSMKYDPYVISIRTNPSTSFLKFEYFNGRQSDLIDSRILIEEATK